jgi:hypothetical protein
MNETSRERIVFDVQLTHFCEKENVFGYLNLLAFFGFAKNCISVIFFFSKERKSQYFFTSAAKIEKLVYFENSVRVVEREKAKVCKYFFFENSQSDFQYCFFPKANI